MFTQRGDLSYCDHGGIIYHHAVTRYYIPPCCDKVYIYTTILWPGIIYHHAVTKYIYTTILWPGIIYHHVVTKYIHVVVSIKCSFKNGSTAEMFSMEKLKSSISTNLIFDFWNCFDSVLFFVFLFYNMIYQL